MQCPEQCSVLAYGIIQIVYLGRKEAGMAVMAPPAISKDKKVKGDRNYLREVASSHLRELVRTSDGRMITKGEAGIERIMDIMMYAESNTDSIAAFKAVKELLYGRAAQEKTEDTRETPRIIFALREDESRRIEEVARQAEKTPGGEEPETPFRVEIEGGGELLIGGEDS